MKEIEQRAEKTTEYVMKADIMVMSSGVQIHFLSGRGDGWGDNSRKFSGRI